MVSRLASREQALTYLQLPQVPAYGEMGAQPAEDPRQGEHSGGIPLGEEAEPEIRTVGRGERRHLAVEQRERAVDEREGDRATREALQQTGVIERPAHE